jgi:hypothetical protein
MTQRTDLRVRGCALDIRLRERLVSSRTDGCIAMRIRLAHSARCRPPVVLGVGVVQCALHPATIGE